MKRLWKTVPPCMSDVIGFEAVMNNTDGLGIIDDPSRYKPIRLAGSQDTFGGHGGFGGGHGKPDFAAMHTGTAPENHDRRGSFGDGHGRPFGHGGRGGDIKVVNSDIRNEDIIRGTEQKVLAAFDSRRGSDPKFVLLSCAPSSSMIGSDLEADAEKISESGSIPAAAAKTDGSKDYVFGAGEALLSIGRLLIKPAHPVPGTVNILGCNSIDWLPEEYASFKAGLEEAGLRIVSVWGMKETTDNFALAASAEMNIVVNESGLKLARFMESEFGTPYICGAPFGRENAEKLISSVKNGAEAETAPEVSESESANIVVIGEQFTANAIRTTLEAMGYSGIRVLSFFDMDKSCMRPGDAKLQSEDDLAEKCSGAKVIFGDRDYRIAAKTDAEWIGLPNPGSASAVDPTPNFNKVGAALDARLAEALR